LAPDLALNALYADPVVYDILTTPGTARELDVLQRIARRWVAPAQAGNGGGRVDAAGGRLPERWLEPACGTGRYLRLAAARGLLVTGFDASPAMVAYAHRSLKRRRLDRRAAVFAADLADFADRVRAGSFDFAYIPDNSLRHLPGERAALAHFAQIARVLRPGGAYAVGLSLSRYGQEPPDEDVWSGTRGRCRVSQVVNYLPPGPGSRRERVIVHLVIERPGGEEHVDAAYDLHCWDEGQWGGLVGRSALRRVASLDARGRPVEGRVLPYQFEILTPR
jgi:SAM-dependent methyltransferase